uniref:Uncharacterized protein n=1 Tax=viral metagenome TaxID=1070528 RepID=A0A6C0JJQ0_9ZZZZ
MFSQYKDILGKEGEGIHSYRFLNFAIMDVLMTIFGAYLIHYFMPNYSFLFILLCLFLSGIFLHRLFGVKTTVDKIIFN